MVAVPHLLQLVNLIQKENIDAKLLKWHELRSHEKLQAHLERVDGVALKVPEYPVEARIYILVGYLLSAENGKKARWGSVRVVGMWEELDQAYGDLGRIFYEAAKVGRSFLG